MIGRTLINYRLTERLGAGGQGEVYKAVDVKLNRPVVVKVLSPELTEKKINMQRFEREAQLASSLDHPNICTIYGLHETEGVHFIAMQYIEGRNVRELVGGRPLELASALSIAAQTSDALAAAHSKGIIHRDIKAGNVMVNSSGLVKVLDFGLAKLLDAGAHSQTRTDDVHLTEFGVPYGTATYAAPEQARGGAADHRADIFSTGVLLYEMLAGTWPFRGKTSAEVRRAVLNDQPRPFNEMRSDFVSPRVQQILDRALAKEPEARYERMEELRDEIKAVWRETTGASESSVIESIAPVAPHHQTGLGAMWRATQRFLRRASGTEKATSSIPPASVTQTANARDIHETPSSSGASAQKSIAILPFRNLSGNTEASFYEFSLADAVITELARLRSLVVRPSSLITKYKDRDADPRTAGRELSVDAILSASFMSAPGRLRVTAQLLDVASGDLLWSDRIDTSSDDVITVQDTIARHIVDNLHIELRSDETAALTQHATTNAAAYEEYLRGRDALGRYVYHSLAREDSDEAIRHFRRSTELDPRFALAHCGVGLAYANRVIKGFGSFDDYQLAEAAFAEALTLDPQLLEARLHMVFIYLARGEKQKARAWIELLRHEAPNDTAVHFVRATLHRLDGEYAEALREFDTMVRLNPAEVVVTSYNRARILLHQNRPAEALAELDAGSRLEPDHPLIKTFRAMVLRRMGQPSEAAVILREVLERNPQMDGIRPILAWCLSDIGEHAAARAELTERVKETAAADHDIAYWLASAYALESEPEEAFKWLERAINLGNEDRPWFEVDPAWKELRDDPRFRELMNRIALSRHARAK
ncbi:MAG: protein kinase [Pyrinomonadaceae bacterium]